MTRGCLQSVEIHFIINKKNQKMVKKILSLALTMVVGLAIHAQTAATAPAKPSVSKATDVVKVQTQNPAAYACPKCFKISKGAGQCPDCKVEKVQLGTYYCTKCMKATGAKPGNCPTCNTATTQMTRKYCAKMGGTPLRDKPAPKANAVKGV
jgi:lipopolysaccharide biosynthesis regulator YciM